MRKLMLITACVLGTLVAASAASAAAFVYDKRGNPIDGVIWGQCGGSMCTGLYRAGSGNGGTTPCQYYNWLPNGTYGVRFHSDSYNGIIKGRVWYLTDYPCSNGVVRTELFIHSEETANQGQMCGSPYDERYCWDGDADYYSLGCIKVARRPVINGYSDLGRLDAFEHGYGPVTSVIVQNTGSGGGGGPPDQPASDPGSQAIGWTTHER